MSTDTPEPPPAPPATTGSVSAWNNWITATGLVITVAALVLLLTFTVFQLLSPSSNPYVSIIGILVLPGILAMGLAIVPLGIALRIRHLHRTASTQKISYRLPRIDLNNPRHRRWLVGFVAVTLFVTVPVMSVSSYYGYHYTDSTEFCAKVCHTVMEPQGATYERSPHARVACAECHIGSGASWFVKSKLSGTRQIFKVLGNTFPRPIPPAITELRPARETCEECHWPAKFHGSQLRDNVHYSPDESNTRRDVRVLLKTGGGDEILGRVEGIHMHMALSARIEYIAIDEKLQDVPWVRMTAHDGTSKVFRSDGLRATDPPPTGIHREVDCMDCHNRTAHRFLPPNEMVDHYLFIGRLDLTLPFIKREAVAVLERAYPDSATALTVIARDLGEFYQKNYSQVWLERRAIVENAIAQVQDLYRHNVFPEMRVDWRTYPDNIGHMYSPGCLRCHDGRHVADDGSRISSECNVCHTFFNPIEEGSTAISEGEFRHSMDLTLHKNLRCEQCHTGGTLPLCRDCHESGTWLESMNQGRFIPTTPQPEP